MKKNDINARKSIAFVPARGGSKGVHKKNLQMLGGKPLMFHTLQAALDSGCFSDIWVSTDDIDIYDTCMRNYENQITVLLRPSSLSSDFSRVEDAMVFHLSQQNIQSGTITLLQPTSPLRNSEHINDAFGLYNTLQCSSLLSAKKLEYPAQKLVFIDNTGKCKPVIDWESLGSPRQTLGISYKPNGAIYITSISLFLKNKSLYTEPVQLYPMIDPFDLDIDNRKDFEKAENFI
tara:strand:- start:1687 stop:2385 length:699 start_codon:yes stop_codon:yes gene_type:complete